MQFGRGFFTGLVTGAGLAAAGYYLYKNNQEKVDSFLRGHGLNIPSAKANDFDGMSLEELMLNKERLEDLIAEREQADATVDEAPESA